MKKVSKGTAAPDSELTMVERELELRSDSGQGKVLVRIRRPVPHGDSTFDCELEIEGVENPISQHASGVDAIQAYELALQSAALHLLASPAYQSGRLTFRGTYDLDLPCPKSYRCLVRTDLERERVLREFAGTDDGANRFAEQTLARLQDKSKVWPDRPEDAPIVLERVLDLRRGRKRTDVRVLFRKPVANRYGYSCALKIEGLLKKPQARRRMLGHDPIDALKNAMCLAMIYLVSSPEYQRGQLTWHGMYDLGMPIVEEVEPLIRKDLHAKVMAEILMNPPKTAH
jgi:hypothetical protein